MKRFKIIYRVGHSKRERVIEAEGLDDAVRKAEQRYPEWESVQYANPEDAPYQDPDPDGRYEESQFMVDEQNRLEADLQY